MKKIISDFDKFINQNKLYNNLALSALYLATFEILKLSIIHSIRSFFSRDIDVTKKMPEQYREKMKEYFKAYQGKKDKEYLACIDWLMDMEAINSEDQNRLIAIKDQRNVIAHELPYLLLDPDRDVDVTLLHTAKDLLRKIDVWWIINVDLLCDENFDNHLINQADVKSGREIMLNHIFKSFVDIYEKVLTL